MTDRLKYKTLAAYSKAIDNTIDHPTAFDLDKARRLRKLADRIDAHQGWEDGARAHELSAIARRMAIIDPVFLRRGAS